MKYEKRPVNIPGWEMYQVDTNGIVYSKKDKPLKYSINHSGYCMVNFYHNHQRKGFAIHTLVAKTFIEGETKERNQVNHIDGNTTNNCVENLEWVTGLENIYHAINVLGHNKFGKNNSQAKAIYGYDKKTGGKLYEFGSIADAARFFVKPNHNPRYIQSIICQIAKSKNGKKSYRGCVWKYK